MRPQAVAFDLDTASLISLRKALGEWEIEVVNGATAASLSCTWNPGEADLLVVKAGDEVAETLGLCRFLAFCRVYAQDFRGQKTLRARWSGQSQTVRARAPLVVLVPPGQDSLVRAVLAAGAEHCLVLPSDVEDVLSLLAHAHSDNQGGVPE
jgi:hypothetical protein